MAHSYSHLYGLNTTGLRYFTVYGPWGRPDMAYYLFTEKISNGESIPEAIILYSKLVKFSVWEKLSLVIKLKIATERSARDGFFKFIT